MNSVNRPYEAFMKKKNKRLPKITIGVLAISPLLGCQPELAIAPRNEVQATQIAELPLLEEQTLLNTKLFLYPNDFSAESFRALSSSARAMDESEREIYRNRRRMRTIQAQYAEELIGDTARVRRKEIKDRIDQNQKDLLSKQSELDEELAKPEADRSASRIRRLERSRDGFKKQVEDAQLELDTFHSTCGREASAAHQRLDQLEEQVKELNPIYQTAFETVGKVVSWYDDMPDRISFRSEQDGRLSVQVTGWSPVLKNSSQVMSFSTEDKSITDAHYETLGGRIRFTVHIPEICIEKRNPETGESEGLHCQAAQDVEFKINRTRYTDTENPDDGRIFYIGDLFIKDPSTGDVLNKGSAKLVDKQN